MLVAAVILGAVATAGVSSYYGLGGPGPLLEMILSEMIRSWHWMSQGYAPHRLPEK
jgi:hypothetical protein